MEYVARFLLYILLTFVFSWCSVYCLFRRLVPQDAVSNVRLACLVLPLGPYAVSLILYALYWLAPGQPFLFYASVIGVLAVVPALLSARALRAVGRGLADAILSCGWPLSSRLMLGLEAVFFLGLCILLLLYPQLANDPLSYLTQGRFFAQERAGDIFPFLNHASGFYSRSQHPPFFTVLLSWAYLFQGSLASSYFSKFIIMYYVFCCLVAAHAFDFFKTYFFNMLFGLILICTPLMASMVIVGHVDVLRASAYLYCAIWAGLLFNNSRISVFVAVGVVVGLSIRVHATCLVVPVFLLFSYFIFGSESYFIKFKVCCCVAVSAFAVAGLDYMYIVFKYGGFGLHTEEVLPVYSVENLNYNEYVALSRGVFNVQDVVSNGILRGFTALSKYSLTYWMMLVGVLLNVRKMKYLEKTFLAQIVLFHLLMIATVCMGNIILIKNSRYLLMMQPFVAYFAVMFFEGAYAKICRS